MNVMMVMAMMTSSYFITAVAVMIYHDDSVMIVDDKTVKFSSKKKAFRFHIKILNQRRILKVNNKTFK